MPAENAAMERRSIRDHGPAHRANMKAQLSASSFALDWSRGSAGDVRAGLLRAGQALFLDL